MKNLTDLSYLREIAAGDDLFIQEIIQTFIRQVPEFSEKMRTYLREEAFSQLAKEAHTAKSSVIIFGLNDLASRLKEFQLLVLNQHLPEQYMGFIEEFEDTCQRAIHELCQQ
jgi:HPt (histidine-containing phosphotransfer) domain-containing protein